MKTGMIFIDGSNLFHDWRATSNNNSVLDIKSYINLVKSKYSCTDFKRTYYFTSQSTTNDSFLWNINQIPYCEVKKGRLQENKICLDKYDVFCSCGQKVTNTITVSHDKGTDVNIAVEMLKHAYNDSYDIAILASRDADFCSVVRIIKDLGKNVELVVFDKMKNSAKELTDNVDNVLVLTKQECMGCVRK